MDQKSLKMSRGGRGWGEEIKMLRGGGGGGRGLSDEYSIEDYLKLNGEGRGDHQKSNVRGGGWKKLLAHPCLVILNGRALTQEVQMSSILH